MFDGNRSVTVGTFHEMSPMSSDPPPRLSRTGPVQLGADLEREPLLIAAKLLLQCFRERLVGLAPLRYPDLLDVGPGRFRHGLVEMLGPGAPEHTHRPELGVGHHRRALRDGLTNPPQLLDLRIRRLPEVVPDGGVARDDVRLVAAVGDDVVRPVLEGKVLPAVVPADVHQLDRVERASSSPRRACRMRGLAGERELDGDEARAIAVAPGHAKLVADVREERDVDVLEEARAHEVGLGADELFGGARPDPNRARQLLALHDLLHGDRRRDVHRLAGVVPFTMAGRALDHRGVIRDAWLLRRLRDAVDVGAQGDHGFARAPRRHERGRDAGDALLDGEPVLLQHVDQVPVRLDLLKTELGEAEDRIDHLLSEVLHRVDVFERVGLETIHPRVILHGRAADAAGEDGPDWSWASGAAANARVNARTGITRIRCIGRSS